MKSQKKINFINHKKKIAIKKDDQIWETKKIKNEIKNNF
jgi:hypothetical protein